MTPPAPWSPTAHAFAQHQFSHVVNFWNQGRPASYLLEALPGGRAKLNVTFQLPHASEVIPPPSHPVPTHQRPTCPLFPGGFPHQGPASGTKPTPTPPPHFSSQSHLQPHFSQKSAPKKTVSPRRRRKNYQRSVLHRAAQAMSSLPPPKSGSLRQAAQVCVQRLQAAPALQEHSQSERKRPLPTSPSDPSPSHLPPLSQRIRRDIQIGENEVESPEKEVLRFDPFIENSPALFSPCLKDIPSPVSLVFTPVVPEKPSCSNCDAEMTLDHQCDCEATESDSSFKLASPLTLPSEVLADLKSKPRPSPSAPVVLKKPVRMLDGSPAFPPRQKGKNN